MIIDHPLLGPRDASEFVYLGDASLMNRPSPKSETAGDDFYQYQYLRLSWPEMWRGRQNEPR